MHHFRTSTYREVTSGKLRKLKAYMVRASKAASMEELEVQFLEEVDDFLPNDTPCWNNFHADLSGAISVKSHGEYDAAFIPLYESFAETVLFHPVVSSGGWESLEAMPRRISDFESMVCFRDNPLYQEVYRHVDANYQIGFLAARLSDRSLIFTLNRRNSDFHDREVQLLELFGRCMADVTRSLQHRQHLQQLLGCVKDQMQTLLGGDASSLTEKEIRALGALSRHATTGEAAMAAGVSVSTFQERVGSVREKLGMEHVRQLRAVLAEWKRPPSAT